VRSLPSSFESSPRHSAVAWVDNGCRLTIGID
jgi:hypothetical protein